MPDADSIAEIGNERIAPKTSALNGGPLSGFTEVALAQNPRQVEHPRAYRRVSTVAGTRPA